MLIDASVSPSLAPMSMAAASVGDPSATRTVYTTVVVLVVLAVVLAALAVWVLRRTRPEPELLAPLETMATRNWRKLDPAGRRRALDESRPAGALPLRREASEPEVDASFATIAPVASFDDLSELDELMSPEQDPGPGESAAVVDEDHPDVDDPDVDDTEVDNTDVDVPDVPVALAETDESEVIVVAEDDQVDDVPVSDEDTGEIERDDLPSSDGESSERSIDPLLVSKRARSDGTS